MKNLWIILVCVAVGVALFTITLNNPKTPTPVVVMTPAPEVFKRDPVTSPSIVTSLEDGREVGFTIQVYSFHEPQRAEKALEILKAAGYKAFQEVSDLGEKGTFYRVRISGLANEAEAQKVLEDIRRNYQSGFIVKPKK